jgi:hypothetical protein
LYEFHSFIAIDLAADIGPISALAQLHQANLRECTQVHDLSPLKALTMLTSLNVSGTVNEATDVDWLKSLQRLRTLKMRDV